MAHYIGNWVIRGDKMVAITVSDSGMPDRVIGTFVTNGAGRHTRGPSAVSKIKFRFKPDPSTYSLGPASIKFILEHLLVLNEGYLS